MVKVGDRVYYLNDQNIKVFGTVTKKNNEFTKHPNNTIWAIWDDDGLENWISEEEITTMKEKEPDGWSSDYYKLPKGAIELQDLIEHREMNFAIGNIFKAAYRLGNKSGTAEAYDLRKIIWFAERELKRIELVEEK